MNATSDVVPVTIVNAPKLETLNPLAVTNDLSIAPGLQIMLALQPYTPIVENLEGQAERAKISDAETCRMATELMSLADSNNKQLETFRKSVKGPVDDYAKFIQSQFLPLQGRFLQVISTLKKKADEWRRAEEKRLAEEAEAARKRQEAAALQLAESLAVAGDTATADAVLDAATMVKPVTVQVPVIADSYGKKLTSTNRWVGEVTDLKAVLQAIIDEKLPATLVQIGKADLNRIATQVKVEGVHFGIKVSIDRSLSLR